MAEVLLISEKYIKENCEISDNVSGKFLQSAIKEAQDLKLTPILGDALVNKLKALVADRTITEEANAAYKLLLDKYVQRFLMWTVKVDIAHTTSYKLSNFGVTKTSDENVQVASQEEIIADQDYSQAKADAYCNYMQNYLLDNRTLYPELSQNRLHQMKANLYSAASCGVFLGGARGKKIYR